MPLISIGVNHQTAPVEVREALAFDPEQARAYLAGNSSFPERLLLSTCNRTELFAVPGTGAGDSAAVLLKSLEDARGVGSLGEGSHAAVHIGEDAVRHLIRVACGVESMVLGETQILGQVKDAAALAESCGTTGTVLRRALQTAFHVAKKARTETSIGEGSVSVASAAVELAKRLYEDLHRRTALVVGAGETGRLVARHLRSAGIESMQVANRTFKRARDLAKEVGAEPSGLCGVPMSLRNADIVVCSTRAPEPILTFDEVKMAMRARKGRMLLILDIAVPRNVEAKVGKVGGAFLYDIDALHSIVDTNLERRRGAIVAVDEMVEDAVRSFAAWERGLGVAPAIKALRSSFEELRRQELKANLKRIPAEARPQAERLTESLLKRLLHHPLSRLHKAANEAGGGRDLVAALRELFAIEDETDE